jgi:histidinol-phosphate aminotransferase
MYEVYAGMAGAEIRKVRYGFGLNIDKEEFIKKITSGISIVCLANPDSPTGASYDRGFILRCLKKCINTGAVLLIDEAYYHFSKDTVIKDIMTKDNLIVTRTFSKAFGLAGCRAGFMAASKNLTAGLKKARPMYEMNALSAMLAKLCADAPDEAERYARQIDGSREYVISACSKIGIKCMPSRTNFMNMVFPDRLDVSAFEAFARKRGCLLKSYREQGCFKNNVRITLGPKPYMTRFLGSLKEFITRFDMKGVFLKEGKVVMRPLRG